MIYMWFLELVDTYPYGSAVEPAIMVNLPQKEIKLSEPSDREMQNIQQVEVEVHTPHRPQFSQPIKPLPKMYPEEPSMNPLYEYQSEFLSMLAIR